MTAQQSARSILMITPASFGYDTPTEASNKFMIKLPIDDSQVTSQAMAEFDVAINKLKDASIDVVVHEGNPDEYRPSATFPNNWITTWPDGRVYTYPMSSSTRRVERDKKVIDQLAELFTVEDVIDISESENEGRYLESTGAIVFDHIEKVAYGCLSERCDERSFFSHVEQLGYEPLAFSGFDQNGAAIYHTNVMMGIQSTTAVICSSAITNHDQQRTIMSRLGANHQIVDISFDQLGSYCGNVLEATNKYNQKYLILSQTACDAFTQDQLQVLSSDKQLLPISIPTIEAASGGSIRCMLAEIFLPSKYSV